MEIYTQHKMKYVRLQSVIHTWDCLFNNGKVAEHRHTTAPFPSLYLSLNSPVQRIVLHPEIVSREVAGRVAEVVELIPEYAAVTRRSRNDGHLDGEVDLGLECLSS